MEGGVVFLHSGEGSITNEKKMIGEQILNRLPKHVIAVILKFMAFYEHVRSEHAHQWEPFPVRVCMRLILLMGAFRHCEAVPT